MDTTYSEIPLLAIQPNPRQPRTVFDEAELQELADSIREHGVKQALRVFATPAGGGPEAYTLIMGERRWLAAQKAGLTTVPCIIEPSVPTERQLLEWAVIENVQRVGLCPADEARAYQRLHDEFKLADEQIAQRVGKSRSSVTSIRNLTRLPASVLAQVGDGEGRLALRYARSFVPVAAALKESAILKAVKEITKRGDDPEQGDDPEDIIDDLVSAVTVELPRETWDIAWPSEPIGATDEQGGFTIPACRGCPSYLATVRRCADKRCFDAKGTAWAAAELARVSKKLRLAVAGQGEVITAIKLDYRNAEKIEQLIKAKADHLRLIPRGEVERLWQMSKLIGSPEVFLATTRPDLLNAREAAVAPSAVTAGAPANETDADEIKRLALVAEEQARDERRKEKGAKRRATADIDWMGLNTAKLVAPQIMATGITLTWLYHYVGEQEGEAHAWLVVGNRLDAIEKELADAKGPAAVALMKEAIILALIGAKVRSTYDEDWHEDFDDARHDIEEIVSKPRKGYEYRKEASMGLTLPDGWDQPPIHKTESNCWHCGVFTSNAQMTQRDRDAGWGTMSHGSGKDGMTLDDVYCPDCGKKIIAKVRSSADKRVYADGPTAKKAGKK
jgi:ParB/RepB/Spo0J family partition protein